MWFVPTLIWFNAGFGSLRALQPHLDHIEPRYDPTVVPLHAEQRPGNENPFEEPSSSSSSTAVSRTKYYSVADYHELYMSGELTPTAVVKALLPLIRRDLERPGKHSVAFADSKVDAVLAAAEASTRRYREKRPLGLFDGVPTAVKDEYDVDGYRTFLGSLNDYTPQDKADGSITFWCVRQLQSAGAILVGKLAMHEFGLGWLNPPLRLSCANLGRYHRK